MHTGNLLTAIALSVGLAFPALAVQVSECDWAASAQNLAEPWEKNSRVLANGAVRIALVDTGGEPVCCSMRLLILAPDKNDEQGNRMCRLIGSTRALGFESLEFDRLTTSYDPQGGLVLTFPYTLYIDGIRHKRALAQVVINVATGTIMAR